MHASVKSGGAEEEGGLYDRSGLGGLHRHLQGQAQPSGRCIEHAPSARTVTAYASRAVLQQETAFCAQSEEEDLQHLGSCDLALQWQDHCSMLSSSQP